MDSRKEISNLPKDVLILLALEMDLPEIINLCQTSSRFNNKICRNNYFWKNKLEQDFGIQTELEEAKQEYYDFVKVLKEDPNRILRLGILNENFRMVKKAVENEANLNLKYFDLLYPATISLKFKNQDIILYLIEKSDITKNLKILNEMITQVSEDPDPDVSCRMTLNLYSVVLPYIAKVNEGRFRPLLKISLIKLEELYNKNKWCVSEEFYKKWKPFYEELAKDRDASFAIK